MSCSNENKEKVSNSNGNVYSVEEFTIEEGGELSPEEWTFKRTNTGIVCFPRIWKEVDTDQAYFFARLSEPKDKNEFCIILKYDVQDLSYGLTGYVKNVYHQMMSDTVEVFSGYTVKKLSFDDREAFYGEFFTTMEGRKYFGMVMYTTLNGYLYDITLKVTEDKRESYYEYFQDILYNFQDENSKLFSEDLQLEEVEIIDLEKL